MLSGSIWSPTRVTRLPALEPRPGVAFPRRIRQFLNGLYEFAGGPASLAEVGLFLGNYLRTPAGVHRDSAHIFCFVVEGRKRVRVWRSNAMKSRSPRKGPTPYDDYNAESVCLDGLPGDILSWPSSYWHVAESAGWPGSSLSLALYYGNPLTLAMLHNLHAWAGDIAGDSEPMNSLPFSRQVPSQLVHTARRAEKDPMRLSHRLVRFWMERITGYGFARLPRMRPSVRLRVGQVVCADPASPILFTKFGRDLVIAVNGRSLTVSYHRDVVKLVRSLTHGRPYVIGSLLAATTPKSRSSEQAIHTTLGFLLRERVIIYSRDGRILQPHRARPTRRATSISRTVGASARK